MDWTEGVAVLRTMPPDDAIEPGRGSELASLLMDLRGVGAQVGEICERFERVLELQQPS